MYLHVLIGVYFVLRSPYSSVYNGCKLTNHAAPYQVYKQSCLPCTFYHFGIFTGGVTSMTLKAAISSLSQ